MILDSSPDFPKIAKQVRRSVLEMVYSSQSSHMGSAFSMVDALVVLYFEAMKLPDSPPEAGICHPWDRFVLSKAHASAGLYAVLAERGILKKELLRNYYQDGGALPGHLDRTAAPGIENSGGSLGHGLSIALGLAYSKTLNEVGGRVYCLVGDGECNEGSIWEAAMLAGHLKTPNLTVLVDKNRIQSLGFNSDIIQQDQLAAQWHSFGWHVQEINGHSYSELSAAFKTVAPGPNLILLNTIKGKGVSFMENQLEWHYRSPSKTEFDLALKELS